MAPTQTRTGWSALTATYNGESTWSIYGAQDDSFLQTAGAVPAAIPTELIEATESLDTIAAAKALVGFEIDDELPAGTR